MKSFAIAITGFLLGLIAHSLWGTRFPPAPAIISPMPAQTNGAGPFDWERMRMELRLALRDEAAQSARRVASEASAVNKPPDAPPTAEQKEALMAQGQLLDAAIKAGVWRDEDAMKLRTLMPKMAPADRFGALTGVSKAINQGQLKLEAHVPF
jgi:hypothetical protein